jgi:putative DNA primase/helicase
MLQNGFKQSGIIANVDFKKLRIDPNAFTKKQTEVAKNTEHKEVLVQLLKQITKIDFRKEVVDSIDENGKLSNKHYLVCCINNILSIAHKNNWGICINNGSVYLFNSEYWNIFDIPELQNFLGEAAEKMGVDKFHAQWYSFREQLYKQFLVLGNLPKPEQSKDVVLVSLKNGVFEISPIKQELRLPKREDFMTYQLPFEYNPAAKAPMFQEYLDKVQPDKSRQNILSEYLGYVFIKTENLKLEKVLLLYGGGANGKSVFFDIVSALFGKENVSNYALQSLTNENGGAHRAKIANTLINYASEISGKLESSIFKAMASGEPIEARPLYAQPFLISNYAKLIFNCNELPKDTEQSHAYFRRFLIVPFDVTIPDGEQDAGLSQKIIQNELSGVFNWVLEGLKRILAQKKFTDSEAVNEKLEQYKLQSDSVRGYIEEESYHNSMNVYIPLKEMYKEYERYCQEWNYRVCGRRGFTDRLRNIGFEFKKIAAGMVVYAEKKDCFLPAQTTQSAQPENQLPF